MNIQPWQVEFKVECIKRAINPFLKAVSRNMFPHRPKSDTWYALEGLSVVSSQCKQKIYNYIAEHDLMIIGDVLRDMN